MSEEFWLRVVTTVPVSAAAVGIAWAVAWCIVEVFREAGK